MVLQHVPSGSKTRRNLMLQMPLAVWRIQRRRLLTKPCLLLEASSARMPAFAVALEIGLPLAAARTTQYQVEGTTLRQNLMIIGIGRKIIDKTKMVTEGQTPAMEIVNKIVEEIGKIVKTADMPQKD
eukprot:TRINITY_DN7876_c0_g1_i1.p3 TRINITY_DN7876_c0_g1~~TRINITY_DN7876_c0_g1_i1.p3  ORF type:complete len:127 (-),score=19.57 TRINITY_DN7876_c0_g1_i1:307-687(-)